MAEVVSPYALTTLQRVKDILFDPGVIVTITGCSTTNNSPTVTGVTVPTNQTITAGQAISGLGIPSGTTIASVDSSSQITLSANATATNSGINLSVVNQPTAYDTVLTRLINGASEFITAYCGRDTFVQKTFTDDVYSVDNVRQSVLILRNPPVFPASQSDIFHTGEFDWRAGTPSNPSWTAFIPDQQELINPHFDPASGLYYSREGMIRVYGVMPRIYNNMLRVIYLGGYPVNWANAGDHSTHWLPSDLTHTCENIVTRWFNRRKLAGKASERVENVQTNWRDTLDNDDLMILAQYTDVHI